MIWFWNDYSVRAGENTLPCVSQQHAERAAFYRALYRPGVTFEVQRNGTTIASIAQAKKP